MNKLANEPVAEAVAAEAVVEEAVVEEVVVQDVLVEEPIVEEVKEEPVPKPEYIPVATTVPPKHSPQTQDPSPHFEGKVYADPSATHYQHHKGG